jgi:DNA polymerase (family X)
MLSNKEIRKQFEVYAELLQLHRKDEKLSGILSATAFRLRRISEAVIGLSKTELSELFRPQIVKAILQLQKTGNIKELDELIQLTPPGLFEMMQIKGLGGKKLSVLWKKAKVNTIDELLEACKNNMLSKIPGFGAKTQQNIIKNIEAYRSNENRFYYASVADVANELVLFLQKILGTKLVSLCGEIRRQTLTVPGIDIITAAGSKKISVATMRRIMIVQSSSARQTKGHTLDEIPVTIHHSNEKNFYRNLFANTGNENHVKKVLGKIKAIGPVSSEEMIYKKAKLPFIVPEMREDIAEWNFAKRKGSLLTLQDIKGVVHNHTTYSDGIDSLEDFVNACRELQFEYAVISDHSKNAHYAGGLKEEKVQRQFKEIDALNKEISPFHIFKSIECDILVNGDLDFDKNLLKKFDLVIVSIHQALKMEEEKATRRLIKAIENPYTTILGHMTGRQLLIRPGYPVNFRKVIDACAANKVVIEINANPRRLDMDWSQIPYALNKGVMISVNPDAHSIAEIENIRWGVSAARKGGLTKEMTWNAMSLKEIKRWLRTRKN